jgi:hypothetical protein
MATYVLPLAAAFAIVDNHRFNRALLAIGLATVSAYTVFLALPVDRVLLLLVLSITVSTLLVKQPLLVDVFAGGPRRCGHGSCSNEHVRTCRHCL